MAFATILQARLMTSITCVFRGVHSFARSPLFAGSVVNVRSTTHASIVAIFMLFGGLQLTIS